MFNRKKNKTWVMFQNAGEANFLPLFFLGLTDKHDDPEMIGQFGAGFKQAVVAALRLGIEVQAYIGGTRLVFERINSGLWAVGADGTGLTFLRVGSRPAYQPAP